MNNLNKLECLDSALHSIKSEFTEHVIYKKSAENYCNFKQEDLNLNTIEKGTFIWINGDRYEGCYKFNYRHGYGIQVWSDGSSYEGDFYEDKKSGKGIYRLLNGEEYIGTWVSDFRHGFGTYKWNNGHIYEGMFFMNLREGFGKLIYNTGNYFMGLYKHDNRYGPGILTYSNNSEDIGFWNGDKLIRLLCKLAINYETKDIDQIDRKIFLNSWYDRETLFDEILNPQNIFCNKDQNKELNRFIREDPYLENILFEKKKIIDEYLRICNEYNMDIKIFETNKIIEVPNTTPNLIEMFKHHEKYFPFKILLKEKYNFDLTIFESCNNANRKKQGVNESYSMKFLEACIDEDLEKIKTLKHLIDINVCDNQGINALLIAVMKCNFDIINFLLDNGANVNHLLDNGLSSLMICVIRYYTSEKFLPNTALKHIDLPVSRKLKNESIVHQQIETLKNYSENVDENETIVGQSTKSSDFESCNSVLRYKLSINNELINKYASLLSTNKKIALTNTEEKLRNKAAHLYLLNRIGIVIELLLKRGANPSNSQIPYPALCFAVAAGDTKIVKLLLEKGANCNNKMPMKFGSLSPLCLACGVLGDTGPELVELLLRNNADPNDSADIGNEYISMIEEDWEGEPIPDELINYISGRTPLHIACARNDHLSAKIVKLLIEHSANPNLICNGQSPLSLAIASGNRDAIDILLKSSICDPSLPLTFGIGSALCAISSTLYEHNWTPSERIKLIDKLIYYGANILQPIAFGPRRYIGTVVDYAHYMHSSDARIAHTPYHSLTYIERETYNSRKELLNHIGKRFREKISDYERNQLYIKDRSDDAGYTNWGPAVRRSRIQHSSSSLSESETHNDTIGKKNFKWCYTCGRSVSVKLSVCSRCKRVYYCSNACKQRAWNEFHKKECSKSKIINENIQQNNELALNFVNQEHNSFLSENAKSKATTRHDANSELQMNSKQISFFIDEKEHHPTVIKSGKSVKSAFSKQMELKMAILEKKLGRKRFHNDGLSINPIYNAQENYSFN